MQHAVWTASIKDPLVPANKQKEGPEGLVFKTFSPIKEVFDEEVKQSSCGASLAEPLDSGKKGPPDAGPAVARADS